MKAAQAASAAKSTFRTHTSRSIHQACQARSSLRPPLPARFPARMSRRSISIFRRKTAGERAKSRIWTFAGLVLGGLFAVYAYDSSAGVHRWLVVPLLHTITKDDPEASHKLAIDVLASGLSPVDVKPDQEDILGFELWGRHFSNPVGLAAGFDKDGQAIDGLFKLGFSYVEIGSVTPQAQPGNPAPRLFRLPSSQSVINRYGFNSEGHFAVLERLQERIHAYLTNNALLLPPATFPTSSISANPDPDPIQAVLTHTSDTSVIEALNIPRSLYNGKILAVNLGKNKASAPESIDDFVAGVQTLGPYADVLVINVSSPNTPGLRSLQRRGILQELLGEVVTARNALKLEKKPVVLLKIAPDLSRQEITDIAGAAKASKVDGIIVSNTTLSRPPSAGSDPTLQEKGGLSGPPLKPLSIRTLQTLYALTSGSIPLVGCGGISTGADAIEYARAGASFVQFYTALGYQGVGLPRLIKDEIVMELKQNGKTWKEIVGSGVDLESIKRLGRDSNPVGLLSLEEGVDEDLENLTRAIEDAIGGSARANRPDTSPRWQESPAFAAESTVPSAVSSSSANTESGLIPDETPQIIIFEKPPSYKPAEAWTRKDVERTLAEGKGFAKDFGDGLETAADITQEAFKEAGSRFEQIRKDILEDPLAKDIADVTRAATAQAVEGLTQVGRDIKDDQFAREVADITKQASKQAADGFRHIGREIQNDDFAKELKDATEGAIRQAADGFKKIGQDIRDDTFLGDAREVGEQAARQAFKNFQVVGRNIRDEGDFTAATKEVVSEAVQRALKGFQKVGTDIRDQGDFSNAVKEIINDAASQAVAKFQAVGRNIRDEGDLPGVLREGITSGSRQASEGLETVGRKIKDEGDFTGTVRDTTAGAAKQGLEGLRKVGTDIRDNSSMEDAKNVIKGSTAQVAQRLKEVGREISNDPLLARTNSVEQGVKEEIKSVAKEVSRGPSSEPQRSGGGLFSLFSTFGERGNVTSESKRQV